MWYQLLCMCVKMHIHTRMHIHTHMHMPLNAALLNIYKVTKSNIVFKRKNERTQHHPVECQLLCHGQITHDRKALLGCFQYISMAIMVAMIVVMMVLNDDDDGDMAMIIPMIYSLEH